MRFSFRKVMLFALSALPLFALEASAQGNGNEVGTTDTLLLTLDDALRIAASDNYTVQIAELCKEGRLCGTLPSGGFLLQLRQSHKETYNGL